MERARRQAGRKRASVPAAAAPSAGHVVSRGRVRANVERAGGGLPEDARVTAGERRPELAVGSKFSRTRSPRETDDRLLCSLGWSVLAVTAV